MLRRGKGGSSRGDRAACEQICVARFRIQIEDQPYLLKHEAQALISMRRAFGSS